MDPFILGAVAAGSVFNMVGGIMSRRSKRKASQANADFLRRQAQFFERGKRRAIDIYRTESNFALGQKENLIARSGVQGTGSTLMSLIRDRAAQGRQIDAIKAEFDNKIDLARFQAGQFDNEARLLKSAEPFFLGGSVASGIADYKVTESLLKKGS